MVAVAVRQTNDLAERWCAARWRRDSVRCVEGSVQRAVSLAVGHGRRWEQICVVQVELVARSREQQIGGPDHTARESLIHPEKCFHALREARVGIEEAEARRRCRAIHAGAKLIVRIEMRDLAPIAVQIQLVETVDTIGARRPSGRVHPGPAEWV